MADLFNNADLFDGADVLADLAPPASEAYTVARELARCDQRIAEHYSREGEPLILVTMGILDYEEEKRLIVREAGK